MFTLLNANGKPCLIPQVNYNCILHGATLTTEALAFLQCAQDVFSRVNDHQWLGWGTLLLPGLNKVMEDEDTEHEQWA